MYSFVYDALQSPSYLAQHMVRTFDKTSKQSFGLLVLSDTCHFQERAPYILAQVPG